MKRLRLLGALCAAFLCTLFAKEARATHAAGAELIYVWVSDSTYRFYWKFYKDCAPGTAAEPPSQQMCYYNPCTGLGGSITLQKVVGLTPVGTANGSPVSTGCPPAPGNQGSTCTGGTLPGFREWWYTGVLTLPARCTNWTFHVTLNARNNSINNLVNPGAQSIYVETTFNNLVAQGNSSPYFTVQPAGYLCVNTPFIFNNGGLDINNDSLAYEVLQPRTNAGSCANAPNPTNIPYPAASPAYNTLSNPLQTNNTFTLSPATGMLSFTPTLQGNSVLTVRCNEYRNGVLIGSVLRDIQLAIISCNIQQPNVGYVATSLSGATLVGNTVQGCATQAMSFCVNLTSPDTSAILVATTNVGQAIPGANLTFTGQQSDSILACFNWTPGVLDTGLKVFTITVKDSSCKPPGIAVQQTFTFPIYVNPKTVAFGDTTICPYDGAQLTAFGGSQFTWSVLPGGSPISSLSCNPCKNPIASPLVTTTYVVQSDLQSLCNQSTDTVTIQVAVPAGLDVGPDITTCINDTVQLNVALTPAPGVTYGIQWTPATGLSNDTILNPLAYPTVDTRYIVTATPLGVAQCSSRDTIDITVLQGFNVFTGDTVICLGSGVNIAATGDPRYTYLWQPVSGVSLPNVLSPTITPSTTGTYTYTVTATFPGCSDSSQSLEIEVQPLPTVTINPDQTLCYGDTVHLNAVVTPTFPGYTYTWNPGSQLSATNIPNPIFNAIASQTLGVTVSTPAGCEDEDEVTFNVIAANFIELSNDTALCPRDTAQLLATATNGVPVVEVRWKPNQYLSSDTIFNPLAYPVTTTTYSVIARDSNYCLDSGAVTVFIHPEAVVTLPDSVRIYPGESYQMDPGGNCLYFQWFPPYALSSDTVANPIAKPEVNTRYFVSASTEAGCTTSDSMDIFVSYESAVNVANAFTPGATGPNGILMVSHRGLVSLRSFRIYNRWGTKVFETSDITKGWDGSFNGQPQPMGVYVYMVEGATSNGRSFSKQGNVTLIR